VEANDSSDVVRIEVAEQILVVTLSRPEKRNAVNAAVTVRVRAALDRLEADPALRVGILTGAGGTFCSGADLRAGPAGERLHDEHGFASVTRRRRTKPLIAAVEGAAVAGGFEIALACDIIVAAENSAFGLPEPKRGVLASTGLVRLPRYVGFPMAAEIALTGDPLPAARAYSVGLVSRLAPAGDTLKVALEVARSIAANAPGSIRETLHVLRDSHGLPEDEGYLLARAALRRLSRTDDFREGPRSFVEHRAPRWSDT
jgi:enoyl-CoA hydratase